MSAAKIAASLRSTGWSGTLGSSPSEYSQTRNRRATLQVGALPPVRTIVRFPAGRLGRRRIDEGVKRVGSGGQIPLTATTGIGATPPFYLAFVRDRSVPLLGSADRGSRGRVSA